MKIALSFWHILLVGASVFCSACYSFKGISIPPNTKTFVLPNLQVASAQADAGTALQLTEKLKQKILQTTRLTYNAEKPDIEMTGSITSFGVQSLAPTGNNQSQLSRFKMSVLINYKNSKDDNPQTAQWSQSFEQFVDFNPATQNFESVRTSLIQQVNDLLVEVIYTRAFSNW
jgi:Lipopolysaccharide-assembly